MQNCVASGALTMGLRPGTRPVVSYARRSQEYVTTMLVSAAMQAPGVSLCVCTTLLVRPNAGLNDPLKPAAVQAARAFATVNPTRFGTIWQAGAGAGVGVGDGAGDGVGAGVGNGSGVGLGNGAGVGVSAGGGAVGVGGVAAGGAAVGVPTGSKVGAGVGAGPPILGPEFGVAPAASGAGLPGDVLPPGDVAVTSPTAGVPFGAGDGVAVSNLSEPAVTGEGEGWS
jgi:hypothetical protein